ncbi:hypothetical protein [uncultured Lacinutrix sp.]|uniref:hypothetical protein n=1 Tax=uncultured Lacinutrix sp. TaxID=574032 RepID=UPI00260B4C37|nr:hypothetical protein [uncultured Lacinutrix sp.]
MKRIIFSLCIIAFAFSCSTDSTTQTQQPPESNFYALTVGNSWVYKNYRYNPDTEEYDDTGVVDSISIVGTEDLFGVTYFKFRRLTTGNEEGITFCNANGEHFEYLREYQGALIRDDGTVKYVNNDFSERELVNAGWGIIYEALQEGTQNVTVESGVFECLDAQRYARDSDNNTLPAIDHHMYSDGIGLVYDTSSFVSSSTHSIERRLDSYNVQ